MKNMMISMISNLQMSIFVPRIEVGSWCWCLLCRLVAGGARF